MTGSGVRVPLAAPSLSNPIRKPHDEAVAVRHLHLWQRLRVHGVVLADQLVEREDVGGQRVDLVDGAAFVEGAALQQAVPATRQRLWAASDYEGDTRIMIRADATVMKTPTASAIH